MNRRRIARSRQPGEAGFTAPGQLPTSVSHAASMPADYDSEKRRGRLEVAPVLADDGAVYSWGAGDDGRLGHGDYEAHCVPRRIAGLGGVRVLRRPPFRPRPPPRRR